MSTMEQFYTRQKAGEGVKIPLFTPDGQRTEEWIRVRGVDSDEFRTAEAAARRKAMEFGLIEDDNERRVAIRTEELRCIAALIADWSFEFIDPNTVVNFLREAPQIADAINRLAAKRALFFAKKQKPSSTGSDQSSD